MGTHRTDYEPTLKALPETDKARLAAYLDSEGTIYINVATGLYGRAKTPQYRLSVVITNTDPRLMSWLKAKADGSVYHVKYENCKHLGKKPIMRWQINERMAESLLRVCLPYMLIKKEQAEVGLSFMKLKQTKTRQFVSPQLTESDVAERHAMKLEIERLNKSDAIPATAIN